MDSGQPDTRLCTVGAAIDSTCEPEAGANTMKCTMIDGLMGDWSTRCPKKSGRTSAEVLRAEVDCLWHSGLPISSRFKNQPEPYGTVHEPELACRHPGHADVRVHLGGRVTKYLRKIHCSRAQFGIMRSAAFFDDDARCNNGFTPVREISAHARNGISTRAAVSRHIEDKTSLHLAGGRPAVAEDLAPVRCCLSMMTLPMVADPEDVLLMPRQKALYRGHQIGSSTISSYGGPPSPATSVDIQTVL